MERRPAIALVAAVARNGVIGSKGGLPWRLPSDLKRFKAITMGKPLIMGRKTMEAIGRPLPGRTNIVISTSAHGLPEGFVLARSVDEAIKLACQVAKEHATKEICVIGGEQIYRQTIGIADRLYITHVDGEPEGDRRFPSIDPQHWRRVSSEEIERTDRDSMRMELAVYDRVGADNKH